MASEDDEDDDIPLLEDVLRPGDTGKAGPTPDTARSSSTDAPLSDAEIEAIASRVIERHTKRMEEAVSRAIRQAIDMKARMAKKAAARSEGTQD